MIGVSILRKRMYVGDFGRIPSSDLGNCLWFGRSLSGLVGPGWEANYELLVLGERVTFNTY
jgi:hypothetical protein